MRLQASNGKTFVYIHPGAYHPKKGDARQIDVLSREMFNFGLRIFEYLKSLSIKPIESVKLWHENYRLLLEKEKYLCLWFKSPVAPLLMPLVAEIICSDEWEEGDGENRTPILRAGGGGRIVPVHPYDAPGSWDIFMSRKREMEKIKGGPPGYSMLSGGAGGGFPPFPLIMPLALEMIWSDDKEEWDGENRRESPMILHAQGWGGVGFLPFPLMMPLALEMIWSDE